MKFERDGIGLELKFSNMAIALPLASTGSMRTKT